MHTPEQSKTSLLTSDNNPIDRNSMMITLKDVASASGFSIHTVSDILNGEDPRYSQKTQLKVRETAEKLGYRPNRQARVLRGAKSGIIGMIKVVNVIQTAAERALFAGEAIYEAGYELLAYDVHWHQEGLSRAVDFMLDTRVEGVLFAVVRADFAQNEAIKRLKASGIPLVAMGGGQIPEIPYVSADFFQGGQLLARHLLEQGYRKIAFIMRKGDLRHDSNVKRFAGVESVFCEAGISVEVVEGEMPSSSDDALSLNGYTAGFSAACEVLKGKKKFDVLICINDYVALAAIRAAKDMGIRVPEDLAVVGFDDVSSSRYSIPRLTTVFQPVREVAVKAVDVLLNKITKNNPHVPEVTELPCKLIVRESCRTISSSTPSKKVSTKIKSHKRR